MYKYALSLLIFFLVSCAGPAPEQQPIVSPNVPTPSPIPEEVDTWDLVYISDSSGLGVQYYLADYIEEDLGITVTIQDYVEGSLSAQQVLYAIRGETEKLSSTKLEDLREIVAEAEMIVLFANPAEIEGKEDVEGPLVACIKYRACIPPVNCEPEVYNPYIEILNEIYKEIFSLRDGKPTIIRATDFFNPLIDGHKFCEMENECTRCWETFNNAVRIAAEDNNIPFVSVYDLFNGGNHDEDPVEKGLIGNDYIHASKDGIIAIADLLREAGYDPIGP